MCDERKGPEEYSDSRMGTARFDSPSPPALLHVSGARLSFTVAVCG